MKNTTKDVNDLLDDLVSKPEVQARWEDVPEQVMQEYQLTPAQYRALSEGNIDALINEGLADRHVQQMRVSW
ncbi:hypothetical protein KKI90_05115 [Xenorhabdus bovienii]|uniref:Extradiol ring-cleavage dioxygenase LigAB LigA subunit domain-containing protein n=2 Tax=Xenorhabdus TaxID=626 RepID=A0AAJ1N1C4_XENBV|nr:MULTISPECIES: hypothetical protein [Xenorhabdus]MDC9621682.1 hypothetical protein [Xenorhabdus aichiensis]MDE1480398.1 hypothetical protein [Xenorhabdus bovienii]MDE1485778.1 hypothetical protein [Xenorhabdus bovienii]MDE1491878.1 hypothetical protein [Xenorhabdus bovienii]MDE1495199.1 hypothetical protein [Xenorhabdus bovienii]